MKTSSPSRTVCAAIRAADERSVPAREVRHDDALRVDPDRRVSPAHPDVGEHDLVVLAAAEIDRADPEISRLSG
jgi:hypothetical protein